MSTITVEQQAAIATRLEGMTLPSGLGTKESACSIAAINLALTGELTDDIPACMSEVIGRWIIPIQDAMPDAIRNSVQWKALLPLAAGTGRDMERERLDLVMDWMWGKVLPALQPVADRGGFGDAWSSMITHRTADTAEAAAAAARAAKRTAAAVDAEAKAWAAAFAASYAADAAWFAASRAVEAAEAAVDAAKAAWAAVDAAKAAAVWVYTDAWTIFDPCDLLDRLIRVGEQSHAT